jgi:hypothetical protein
MKLYSNHVHKVSLETLAKGKVHPVTCHEDTEEEWRYRLTLSLILALYSRE